MRIGQLVEGQERQIANLHTSSPLRLYMPLSIKDALRFADHGLSSVGKHTGETGSLSKVEGMPVTHSLKYAVNHEDADVVIQFMEVAKHLSASDADNNANSHQAATMQYPKSQMPIVSLLLLDDSEPYVRFHGILDADQVDLFHLVGYDERGRKTPKGNVNTSMRPHEFEEWEVSAFQNQRRYMRDPIVSPTSKEPWGNEPWGKVQKAKRSNPNAPISRPRYIRPLGLKGLFSDEAGNG